MNTAPITSLREAIPALTEAAARDRAICAVRSTELQRLIHEAEAREHRRAANNAVDRAKYRIATMRAERAALAAEFNDLVVAIRAAQATDDPANTLLSRLQAIDRALQQLDADAAARMAECLPLLAGGGDA